MTNDVKKLSVSVTESSIQSDSGYALLDSGLGEKLERFGEVVLSRPDPQALWSKNLSVEEWKKADGHFTRDEKKGEWALKKTLASFGESPGGKPFPDRWLMVFSGLKFWIKPTAFKHVGLFPEQSSNWDWMRGLIKEKISAKTEISAKADNFTKDFEVLNLFGYTGGASIACAQAGAKVVHIDGSKVALTWARDNAEASSLGGKPIRWILDDVRTFVKREIKRGRKYHGIIMDPPAFGHGPDNEVWKIEEDLPKLIEDCVSILVEKPEFFLINGYASGYSALAYENLLAPLVKKFGGIIETGELAIREITASRSQLLISSPDNGERLLPCGIFARWSATTK